MGLLRFLFGLVFFSFPFSLPAISKVNGIKPNGLVCNCFENIS